MSAWIPPGHGQEVVGAEGYTMKLAEAAVRLGITPSKLGTWRAKGVGPSWSREGTFPRSPILYRPAEIEAVREDMQRHRDAEARTEVVKRIERKQKPQQRRQRRRK